jgi:endoribonuclease Dicer
VADVAEAIIGAAYISGGREGALKACRALQLPIPYVACWSDFGRKAMAPPPAVSAQLRPGSVEAVEKIIGHKFARPHLLAQALVCDTLWLSAMRS